MSIASYQRDGDEAVRLTNDDASICKKFAVQKGYWKDQYLPMFVRSNERKAPEINRGYFARVKAITILIHKFIKMTDGKCQIVNFGAGFDTLFWKLRDENLNVAKFVELDFPNVTARKCQYVRNSRQLMEAFQCQFNSDIELRYSKNELHSDAYHLVAVDLRKVTEVESKLSECLLEKNLPTLFLFECVLVYMPIASSWALLRSIASQFPTSFCINYEQVNMLDRFGDVMLNNLHSRGCSLAGVEACVSLKSQEDRFLQNCWDGAQALEMNQVYHSLPQAEIQRIEKIEFLDEKELLDQLLSHYCICVAWNDFHGIGLSSITIHE